MLRFNLYQSSKFSPLRRISIHPMLRFNTYKSKTYYLGCLFQYILCYGSTYTNLQNFLLYVGFQYILCYGSTFWEIFFQDMLKHYFNTSYVTVQRLYQSKHTFT